MEDEEQRIVTGARLPPAPGQQRARVAPRMDELNRPLDGDEGDQDVRPAEAS